MGAHTLTACLGEGLIAGPADSSLLRGLRKTLVILESLNPARYAELHVNPGHSTFEPIKTILGWPG
jgi:hypothetical protein